MALDGAIRLRDKVRTSVDGAETLLDTVTVNLDDVPDDVERIVLGRAWTSLLVRRLVSRPACGWSCSDQQMARTLLATPWPTPAMRAARPAYPTADHDRPTPIRGSNPG